MGIELATISIELLGLICVVVGGIIAMLRKMSTISMLIGQRTKEIEDLGAATLRNAENFEAHERECNRRAEATQAALADGSKRMAVIDQQLKHQCREISTIRDTQGSDIKAILAALAGRDTK